MASTFSTGPFIAPSVDDVLPSIGLMTQNEMLVGKLLIITTRRCCVTLTSATVASAAVADAIAAVANAISAAAVAAATAAVAAAAAAAAIYWACLPRTRISVKLPTSLCKEEVHPAIGYRK